VILRGFTAYWMPAYAGMTVMLHIHTLPYTPSIPLLRRNASKGSSGKPRMVK
jgi:hypothetical protein